MNNLKPDANELAGGQSYGCPRQDQKERRLADHEERL